MLDVTNRLIVIIGGGAVAARKAAGLLAAGATRVRVVSPTFHPDLPDAVERIVQRYHPAHLDGAALAFAATDSPEVNSAVVIDARARGVLVNRVDADEQNPGDFTTPAIARQGPVTITVSAAGSPAIAGRIRDQLQSALDRRWVALAEAMQSLRPMILAADLPDNARRALLKDLATEEVADLATRQGTSGVRAWIESRVGKALPGLPL
jgi:siroheme synthase-like protein